MTDNEKWEMKFKVFEMSYQSLMFKNKQAIVLIFRDISHLKKISCLSEENQIMDLVTSSVTHELLTPLKSASLLSQNLSKTLVDDEKSANEVHLIFAAI